MIRGNVLPLLRWSGIENMRFPLGIWLKWKKPCLALYIYQCILFRFLLTQFIVSIGIIPIIMLPYSAFYSLGLFAFFKIPVAYHLVAFMWTAVLCGSSMLSLFFYKMDALIPHGHSLRRITNFWRIPLYIITFIICPAGSLIAWAIYFSFSNQKVDKQTLADRIGIFTEKLFDDETLALIVIRPSNWLQYGAIAICSIALVGFLVLIIFCATISFIILHNKRSNMSQRTRQMHKSWLIGHLVQVNSVLLLTLTYSQGTSLSKNVQISGTRSCHHIWGSTCVCINRCYDAI